jgi:MFS family permease
MLEDESETERETKPDSHAAFRFPSFRRYLVVRLLTTLSSEMQSVAVGWQIYSITHRPLDLGLAGLAQFLPAVCLFLWAGHLSDRVPRKRILLACLISFAVCSAFLLMFAVRGVAAVGPIYAVLLVNGTVRAFNAPAAQSFLPLILPREVFANAVSWNSSAFQVSTIAGPMIGGVLYGLTGSPQYVYGTALVAYSAAAVALSGVQLAAGAMPQAINAAANVLGGLRYIWHNKLVLGAISLDLFAVLLGGAVALLPVYAREILQVGASGLGLLRSAPGIGAVLTSVIVAHRPLRRKAGLAMLWCVCTFGACTVVFGLSRNLALSVGMLLLLGAADTISVIVRSTMIQLSTPDAMRGRVSAVNMVFIGASNEVGQFESGLTAQWLGTVPAVVLGGVGTIVIVCLWAWLFPSLRTLNRLDAIKTDAAGANPGTPR